MPKSTDLVIRILGDAKGAQQATEQASGAVGKMQKGLGKAVVPAAAVATAVVGIGVAAGKAAAQAQQSVGAVQSVFGKYASTVQSSSESAASSVGLSANAYRELASQIGGQLKNAGVPMSELAGRTDTLIRQGADLAATFGGTTADAVGALGAALRGEADPAERLGLALSDSAVQAQLAAKGQDKLKGSALAAAKAQARMDLIAKQSADSTGQFAREADTASGQQERATAAYQDAAAALGAALLPAMTKGAQLFASIANQASKHPKLFMAIVVAVGALAVGILALNAAVAVYTAVTTLAASATIAAWVAAAWPIIAIVAAVALVVGAIVLLWKKCDAFRGAVIAIWNGIRAAITAVANFVQAVWGAVWPKLQTGAAAIRAFISAAFRVIGVIAGVVAKTMLAIWNRVWPVLSAGIRLVGAIFRLQFTVISLVVRVAAALLRAVWTAAFRAISAALRPVVAAMRAGFNAVGSAARAVAAVARNVLGGAFRAVASLARTSAALAGAGLRALLAPIHAVAGALRGSLAAAFRVVGSVASGIGSRIASGLSGIIGVISRITGAINGLISRIRSIPTPKISMPKLPFGLGKAAPATTYATTRASLRRAPVPIGFGARASGGNAAGVTIVIQGAVDPEKTARQIQRILNTHNRRVGTSGRPTLRTT